MITVFLFGTKKEKVKASELRIGNYLLKDGVAVTIDGRTIFDIWNEETNRFGLSPYQPIKFTIEWLEKLGFNKHHCLTHNIMWRHPHDKKSVRELNHSLNFYWQDKAFIFIEIVNEHGEYGTYPLAHIKYVHQLQNMYFFITNKELKAKP